MQFALNRRSKSKKSAEHIKDVKKRSYDMIAVLKFESFIFPAIFSKQSFYVKTCKFFTYNLFYRVSKIN